jgi:hypothetical protein
MMKKIFNAKVYFGMFLLFLVFWRVGYETQFFQIRGIRGTPKGIRGIRGTPISL